MSSRDVLLEFGQWLANNQTRLTDLQEAIEEDEPDLFIKIVDRFLGRPQTACDRCTQGVMDQGNDHLHGRCKCACHDSTPGEER